MLPECLLQQKSNVDSMCVELNMFTIALDAKLKLNFLNFFKVNLPIYNLRPLKPWF